MQGDGRQAENSDGSGSGRGTDSGSGSGSSSCIFSQPNRQAVHPADACCYGLYRNSLPVPASWPTWHAATAMLTLLLHSHSRS